MGEKIKPENLRPVSDRVAILPDPKEDKTEDGIYKPEDAKRNQHILFGTIVAVGPGTINSPMIMKKDDRVIFPENVGVEISGGIIFMKESQVLSII